MATHGAAAAATRKALAGRKAFKRAGFGMSAVEGYPSTAGQLPEPFRHEFWASRLEIVYTVLSYETPILWVLADGTVVQPDVRYSPTTSQHQGMLYLVTSPEAAF